jgi:7-carboxy-7-deazaguanine synthase
VPSIFLRTFGCNFRCKQFGLKDAVTGPYNPEVEQVIKILNQFEKYEDLPLVNSGCDTYSSIYPEFKHLSPYYTMDELREEFVKLLPHNQWIQPNGNDVHLVITGGEPLLGWQRVYPTLLEQESKYGLRNVTFETNGTQPITAELATFADQQSRDGIQFTFSVSPKLSASGEKWDDAIKPQVVSDYEKYGFTYLKFVVDSPEHFDEADRAVAEYRAAGFMGPVYVMPVGGVVAVYDKNEFHVATEALKRGYYFSPRLQITLWGNQWGT